METLPETDLIYLDHAATTPLDPRVLDAMLPYLRGAYGNAASPHRLGREASGAVEEARGHVALALGADPREIVFTGGATEANNLALKGVAFADAHARLPRRIVTCVTEHHAVLDPLESLAGHGFEIVKLGVDALGHIDLERLETELRGGVRLVSLMTANNETGVRHPVATIGALCREHGALFHTDATQSFGKDALDVDAASIDLVSLSAHKLYGPKGVGALFLRRKRPRVRVAEQMEGGGHESGRRSGTLNVAGIVGLGAAVRIAVDEGGAERVRIADLRDSFEQMLLERIDCVQRNGDPDDRLAGHSNLSLVGEQGDKLLESIPQLCASTAAACTTASLEPSHVLRALGLSRERVEGSVRFTLGRTTTARDVERAVELIAGSLSSR